MPVSTKLSGIFEQEELFTCKWYRKSWWTYLKPTRDIRQFHLWPLIQVRIILDHGLISLFYVCDIVILTDFWGMGMREERKKEELNILKQLFLLLNVGLHFNQNNKWNTCTTLHDMVWEVSNLHKTSSLALCLEKIIGGEIIVATSYPFWHFVNTKQATLCTLDSYTATKKGGRRCYLKSCAPSKLYLNGWSTMAS